jgi:nitroreductase
MQLDAFLDLARSRRAVRKFKPDPLPDGVLTRLLEAARWAPSGYNLQPTHFVTVTDPRTRERLYRPCMSQGAVVDAPATVVFAGDRQAHRTRFERALRLDLEESAIPPAYADDLRRYVKLGFSTGPVGLGWLLRATVFPLLRWFTPMPSLPAVHRRYWVTKQVMLAAMSFMLAAKAAGLGTLPMEGFDEGRVRRLLGIPRRFEVPVIVAVGFTEAGEAKKTRVPLEESLHADRW